MIKLFSALLLSLALGLSSSAFAAGTITKSSDTYTKYNYGSDAQKLVRKVTVSWVGDASGGSVPNLSIALSGYLIKAVTNPGSTAPTDNYDIALGDADDSTLDALGGALQNRDTANTEQVFPLAVSGVLSPIFLSGTYTLSVTNNSVNSATGSIILYLVDQL